MIKLLLQLKKRLPFLWRIIEYINGLFFRLLFYNRIKRNALKVLAEYDNEQYTYRLLSTEDLSLLFELLQRQDQEQFQFFKPHAFDKKTLQRLFNNPSFIMFGVFDSNILIGYFFLRCFLNKKCFCGRIVDNNYQGQGIGKIMGKILDPIAWQSKFRIFSTISIDNVASFNSHKSNNNLKIVKKLKNNYLLIEYVK